MQPQKKKEKKERAETDSTMMRKGGREPRQIKSISIMRILHENFSTHHRSLSPRSHAYIQHIHFNHFNVVSLI